MSTKIHRKKEINTTTTEPEAVLQFLLFTQIPVVNSLSISELYGWEVRDKCKVLSLCDYLKILDSRGLNTT